MSDTITTSPRHRLRITAWAMLTWTEAKLVSRDIAGVIIPIGLPLLILLMQGAMGGVGVDSTDTEQFNGFQAMDAYFVPLALLMVVALIGLVNMPATLTTYRKNGVLRRLSVTPAHPIMVLCAQVVVSLFQTFVGVAIALGTAWLVFDASPPENLLGAILIFLLACGALYSLGMVLAAVAPTANSVFAIGLVLFFGNLALGGGFGPRENLPEWLSPIGEYLPYGAAIDALSATWIGATPETLHIGVLIAYIVVAGAASAKFFRWG